MTTRSVFKIARPWLDAILVLALLAWDKAGWADGLLDQLLGLVQ